MVQRKQLIYLIIPEYHSDGTAIHFHGLIRGNNLDMKYSEHSYRDKPIFNWNDWKLGFSSAIKLENKKGISNYITKYITKESAKIFGKYYFSGGKLNRSVPTEYRCVDFNRIDAKEYRIKDTTIRVKYLTLELKEEKKNE